MFINIISNEFFHLGPGPFCQHRENIIFFLFFVNIFVIKYINLKKQHFNWMSPSKKKCLINIFLFINIISNEIFNLGPGPVSQHRDRFLNLFNFAFPWKCSNGNTLLKVLNYSCLFFFRPGSPLRHVSCRGTWGFLNILGSVILFIHWT